MITNQTQSINGYWIIKGNKWDEKIYTKNQAERFADTLVNCSNCINCSYCENCCYSSNCSYCSNCMDCSNCSNCINCNDSHYCTDCRGCDDSNHCNYCRHCINCSNCNNCTNCEDCEDCNYCRDFETNPQKITSWKMSIGNSYITYYFTNKHEQIVCWFFKGSLADFESKISEMYENNNEVQDYFKWIEKIKLYTQ